MGFTRFDRYKYMTTEVRDILMELTWVPDESVKNMIYGLFDGYFYDELYTKFMEMEYTSLYTKELKLKFEKVYSEIKKYPKQL